MSGLESNRDPAELKKPISVPVFNCHVYVAASAAAGSVTARSSTLPEVVAAGRTEREALQNVVSAFKAAITRYQVRGEAIPWRETPLEPAEGEQPRWIAVHL